MPIRRKRKPKSTPLKVAELAAAVPQVVAHRLTRMALAGPVLSARDRKEFSRMVAEKNSAFAEAFQAMFMQSMRAGQDLTRTLIRSAASGPAGGAPALGKAAGDVQRAALGVFDKGLGPVHRKAVANARRLARTKLR